MSGPFQVICGINMVYLRFARLKALAPRRFFWFRLIYFPQHIPQAKNQRQSSVMSNRNMFIPRPMWFITGIGGIWIRATAFDDFSPLQKCRPAMLPGFPLPMQICGASQSSPAIEPFAGKCSYIKKRVLDEITDKQKAAPKKAFLPPSELLCLCFFIISELEKVVK